MKNYSRAKIALVALAALLLAACARRESSAYQGYLEGEFVYVAAPLAGQLEQLAVTRGARVESGAPLFALEQGAELSAMREAAERLRSAQARLADLRKGSRPSELAALGARLAQARATEELSALELQRANTRFPFGREQYRRFMARVGCATMIRGHERVVEGLRKLARMQREFARRGHEDDSVAAGHRGRPHAS